MRMSVIGWPDADVFLRVPSGRVHRPEEAGGHIEFGITGGHGIGRIECPDTPENRAALGIAPKEEEWEKFPDMREGAPPAAHSDPAPTAREVVELEGICGPVFYFLDLVLASGVCFRTEGAAQYIQMKMPGTMGHGYHVIPDTPRNRWLLRQAGVEVKE